MHLQPGRKLNRLDPRIGFQQSCGGNFSGCSAAFFRRIGDWLEAASISRNG
jgi:hypothetical protein